MITKTHENKRFLLASIILLLLVFLVALGYFLTAKFFYKPDRSAFPQSGSLSGRCDQAPYPAQKLDLSDWKLTLPIIISRDQPSPLEILQPALATYKLCPWFMLTPDGTGVIFRAPVNAPTTISSNYPRSELREMSDHGAQEAFWSSTSGTHTLVLKEAITAVPQKKSVVVAGQIHGDDDDLIVVRLSGQKLYITRSKSNLYTLDENYTLGKIFTVKFVASDGKIMIYYNDSVEPIYILEKKVKLAYFKVGVYTQSNCQTENSSDLCNENNYGEVTVYQALVSHQQ